MSQPEPSTSFPVPIIPPSPINQDPSESPIPVVTPIPLADGSTFDAPPQPTQESDLQPRMLHFNDGTAIPIQDYDQTSDYQQQVEMASLQKGLWANLNASNASNESMASYDDNLATQVQFGKTEADRSWVSQEMEELS